MRCGTGASSSISRFDALRLQEEGIDNIPALLSMKAARQRRLVPISPGMLDLWRGAASLISAVGMVRYKELRNYCLTGEEFLRRVQEEPGFHELLAQQCKINNPGEVAALVLALMQGLPLGRAQETLARERVLPLPGAGAPAGVQAQSAPALAISAEQGG